MLKKYIKALFAMEFSILSQYGDLSFYNYAKMKSILSTWQHQYNGNDVYFDAEWSDNKTRIKIRYQAITGKFIQILEEESNAKKMLFDRSNKKFMQN
jgi:hypothetical protein